MSDLSPLGLPGSTYDDFDLRTTSTTVTLDGVSANANRGNLLKARVIGRYSDLSPSGLPGGRYAFDNKLTVELDGTEAVTAVGDFTVTGGAVDTLTGPGLTASLGALTAHIPVSVSLSGIEGTGALGSLSLSTAAIQALSGTVGTTSLGTLVKADGVAITANGATSGLGDFTVTTAQILSLTGVESTGSVGTAVPATEQTIALSGVAGTTGLGSLTATIPEAQRSNVSDLSPLGVPGGAYDFAGEAEEVTASLTGVEGVGAVAVFDGLTLIQVPDGSTATGAAGATSERTEQALTLTGEAATGQVGSFVLPQSVALEGVQGQTILGGLAVQTNADVLAPLNSVGATGSTGPLGVTADNADIPDGVVATGAAGTLTATGNAVPVDVEVTLDGVQASGDAGELLETRGGHFLPGIVFPGAGKRRVKEAVAEAIEAKVDRKVKRVSRKLKSAVIDHAKQELSGKAPPKQADSALELDVMREVKRQLKVRQEELRDDEEAIEALVMLIMLDEAS